MKLVNRRFKFTEASTIGEMLLDGKHLCFTLEPTDRGLTGDMELEDVQKIKVFGHTAIPSDTYNLDLVSGAQILGRFPGHPVTETPETFMVPELENVKDFEGVLMHPGNYPSNTEGCTLVGATIAGRDFIGDTWGAFEALEKACFSQIKQGGVTYTIEREPVAWKAFQDSKKAIKPTL